ncbi:dethiobiotin synthase [Rickettsiales bacterium]|nr:dethiobiotin synthase [Rickettsiales bacterium]
MNKTYFITSSGTEIGKTFITCSINHELTKQGHKVKSIKPIISGWEEHNQQTDTIQIIQSLKLEENIANIDHISPWRFVEPLSPDMAARKENRKINIDEVVQYCKSSCTGKINFIEGVGGAMVPINEKYTVLDWIKMLDIPAIVVTGTYLGSMSHTLTTLEALKSANIPVKSLILNETKDSSVSLEETHISLKPFIGNIDIIPIKYIQHEDPWKYNEQIKNYLPKLLA